MERELGAANHVYGGIRGAGRGQDQGDGALDAARGERTRAQHFRRRPRQHEARLGRNARPAGRLSERGLARKEIEMGSPVVHWELMSKDPATLENQAMRRRSHASSALFVL